MGTHTFIPYFKFRNEVEETNKLTEISILIYSRCLSYNTSFIGLFTGTFSSLPTSLTLIPWHFLCVCVNYLFQTNNNTNRTIPSFYAMEKTVNLSRIMCMHFYVICCTKAGAALVG